MATTTKTILGKSTILPYVPPAILNPINGQGKSSKSKYELLVYINGQLFADLTGIAEDRHFILIRNDSDQMDFSVNLDALEDYARSAKINSQDILQAGVSEVRILRYGIVLAAGQLMYWDVDLGDDRRVKCTVRGWFELLKYRITTATYNNQTALQIVQDQIAVTQAKTQGNLGFSFGLTPAIDGTNLYGVKTYSQKVIHDIFTDFAAEDNGFDFQFTWDKKINIYYPNMGVIRQDIVFSYPGTIKDIKITNDVTKMTNSLLGRGNGFGLNDQLVYDPLAQSQFGLREGLADFPDVIDNTQLLHLTTSELNLFKDVLTLHYVTLDGSQDPQVGSFNLGDRIRVSVSNVLPLYAGINSFFRVDKIDVTIGKEDDETIVVSTNIPT